VRNSKIATVRGMVFALLLPLMHCGVWGQATIPKTPAGNALQAWLDAIDSRKAASIQAYVLSIDSTQTVDWLVSLSEHSGGFTLLSVTSKGPRLLAFHLKEKATATEAFGSLRVKDSRRLAVLSFAIHPLPPDAVVDDITLDAAEKQRLIERVNEILKDDYLYPGIARKMADALLQGQRRSDERMETDGGAFAFLITNQLRNISHDNHLDVIYTPFQIPQHKQPASNDHQTGAQDRMQGNCGITSMKILDGNVGYLKVDAFPDVAQCRPSIDAAMRFVNHADSLIFDLRQNHGGDPRTVALMASYLFNKPTHLNDMYDPRAYTTEQSWTESPIPGNTLAGKSVFILTSTMTFSGGEEFCYDLKMLGRATLIGERTGGGAHQIRMARIDNHFSIAVPFAKPVNPISKTDWEGSGVLPDVNVKANGALGIATKLALYRQAQ